MAEEVKKEEAKGGAKKAFWTFFKIVLGLAFLALGGLAIHRWLGSLLVVIKGCVGCFLVLAGIITLAIAKE